MVLRLQNRWWKQKRKKALKGGWYPRKEELGATSYSKPEPLLCLQIEAVDSKFGVLRHSLLL